MSEIKAYVTEECPYCNGNIWRYKNTSKWVYSTWFQCPDCGCRTTQFGGYFPYKEDNSKPFEPDPGFLDAINKAKINKTSINDIPQEEFILDSELQKQLMFNNI